MEELLQLVTPTLITLITIILGYLGTKLKLLIDAKLSKEKQDQIMNVIHASVQFVEQVAQDENFVSDKFVLAQARAKSIINGMGLEITDEELQMWIEAFVLELKKEQVVLELEGE